MSCFIKNIFLKVNLNTQTGLESLESQFENDYYDYFEDLEEKLGKEIDSQIELPFQSFGLGKKNAAPFQRKN